MLSNYYTQAQQNVSKQRVDYCVTQAQSDVIINSFYYLIRSMRLFASVSVAQWIARWTSNPEVPGSSPGGDVVMVAWPSGLRRWIKAPVSSEAWVRIPLLPHFLELYSLRFFKY